jgi:hypothetical protein
MTDKLHKKKGFWEMTELMGSNGVLAISCFTTGISVQLQKLFDFLSLSELVPWLDRERSYEREKKNTTSFTCH